MAGNKRSSVEEWWTESLIALVENTKRNWIFKTFKKTLGFYTIQNGQKILSQLSQGQKLPDESVIEADAWDH